MNQLLDSKLIEANDEEEKGGKATEKQENDAMVLWDCVSIFDTEKESDLGHEYISEEKVTTRSKDLLNKDISLIPKIKKFQDNMKKIQKNSTNEEIPKLTISSQDLE